MRASVRLFLALLIPACLILSACGAPATTTTTTGGSTAAASAPAAAAAASAEPTPVVQAQANPGGILLNFWGGWTGPDALTMGDIVKQWNAENPNVQISLLTQGWDPMFNKFVTSARSGDVPDILALHPQDIAQFAEPGLLEDVGSFVSGAGINAADYSETAWKGSIYNSTQYAVPLDLHMHGLYYNTDLFTAAGLDPNKPPTNSAELLDYATKLTLDANGKHPGEDGFDAAKITQYGINMHSNHHAFFQWYALYNQQGGNLDVSNDGGAALDVDKATKAWQWLQDLVYKYHVAPQGQTDYLKDFVAKRTAMTVDGPWQLPGLEKTEGLNWNVAAYPQIFDQPAVWGSGHALALPKQSDQARKDAAFSFIKWLTENGQLWAKSGNLPAKNSVRDTAEFKALKGREAFVSMMPVEHIFPSTPKYAQIFAANTPTPFMQAGQAIILKQEDPKAVSERLSQGITSVVAAP